MANYAIVYAMVKYVSVVFALYVWVSLVRPADISGKLKVIFGLFLAVTGFKYIILLYLRGNFFSSELPGWIIELYSFAFGVLFLLFVLALVKDIIHILLFIATRAGLNVPTTRFLRKFVAALVVPVCLISIYGTFEALRDPEIHEETFEIPRLPEAFDNYKIVQLSDVHICASRQKRFAKKLVERVSALSPDLILITGDLIDGAVNVISADVMPFSELSAKDGVFGVLGNHEYYFNPYEWMSFMQDKLGIKVLLNDNAIIRHAKDEIALIGLADAITLRYGQFELPDVAKAVHGIPDGCVKIVMDHQPGGADINAAAGCDLQLSGHTHGGMAPGLYKIVAWMNGGYVRGRYKVGDMHLYVSSGAGLWNGFLLRIGIPSEITVITLTNGREK